MPDSQPAIRKGIVTMLERRWPTIIINPITITTDNVIMASTAGLKVKMVGSLMFGGETLDFEVKRVVSATTIKIGPVEGSISKSYTAAELAPFNGGTIQISEQERNKISMEPVIRACYEEEPVVALRVIQVDSLGGVVGPDSPAPSLMIGTDDGTVSGDKFIFVNNVKNQILDTEDRNQALTWVDYGTVNARITQIDYTSPTFPGIIARKTLSYTLDTGSYRLDSVEWSIV